MRVENRSYRFVLTLLFKYCDEKIRETKNKRPAIGSSKEKQKKFNNHGNDTKFVNFT